MDVDDEDELALNIKKRQLSREKLMNELNGFEASYKPKNLDDINTRVGEYMTEKERLEKELKKSKELNEEQREEMQKKINELKNEVNNQMEQILIEKKVGVFQKAGEAIDRRIEKTKEAIEKARRFEIKCRIM